MGDSASETTERPSYWVLLTDGRMPLVVVIAAVGVLGNNVVAPVLPALAAGLAVPESRIGLVITAFSLPAAIATPVLTALADIHGRRPVVVPSLLGFAGAGAAIALVDTFRAVLALRAVQGVAIAGIMPVSVTLLGDYYDGAENAAAQGLRTGSIGGFNTAIPVIAGVLAAVVWRAPFALYLLGVPAAALVYARLPEPVDGLGATDGLLAELREYDRSMRAAVGNTRRATLLAGGFSRDVVRFVLITFVPLYAATTMDASLAQGGALLSIRGAAYAVVSPLSGAAVARISPGRTLVTATVVSGIGIGLTVLAPTLWLLGVCVAIYSVGDAAFSPVLKDLVTDESDDDHRAGMVGGLTLLKNLGKTVSPAVFGIVLGVAGFGVVFVGGALIAVTYAAALVVLANAWTIPD